jgi:hypothetical protein
MSRKRLGSMAGNGEVKSGDTLLAKVDYHLDFYQHFDEGHTTEGHYSIPSMKEIEGTVRGRGSVLPMGDKLTLITNEGYSLHFFIQNSATGRIMATGGLVDTEGKPVI